MRETAIVAGVLSLLVGVGVARVLAWPALLSHGQSLMLGAAMVGIPLEALYFVLLSWALRRSPAGAPRGWYWRSFEHHHRLLPQHRVLVLIPFYLGALSFVAIVLGIAAVVWALFRAAAQ